MLDLVKRNKKINEPSQGGGAMAAAVGTNLSALDSDRLTLGPSFSQSRAIEETGSF